TRRVWLPPGRYVDWNDRSVYAGPGFVDVSAPLMTLPLFLAENAIVPMLDADVQTLAPTAQTSVVSELDRADVLDVVVALGASGAAQFMLADGTAIRVAVATPNTPTTLTQVTRDELQSCALCLVPLVEDGQITRLRFNSDLAPDVTVDLPNLEAQ